MSMNISIRQGETLELPIISDDLTADTVRFTASDESGIVIDITSAFSTVNGKRVAEIKTNSTMIATGDYKYMLTIEYSDGDINKLPDVENCEGDCALPVLTVCEANDIEVS